MSESGSSRHGALGGPPKRGSSSGLIVPGNLGAPRDSSVAKQSPAGVDNQVTVISNRAPLSDLPEARLTSPLEVGQSLEGERLGQFILSRFVGGGGMGAVFRALDTTLNREVAVKVLSRDQSGDEETLRRFKNEAQSAARLDHDNIARVYYVGEDRGVHYIVFEFIEGVNIRDLVEARGPLPLAEAVSYTLQVAEALAHASQRDVIHRDIKPSNVLITPDGKAKLVDMGLARLHQVEHPDNDLTASGVTLGTFDYISPEQARDPRSADVRSDLYSLGCSFYYTLTGRPPFPHGTVLQKLLQHQGDEPPDPRAVRPDLPLEVTHILSRLLAKSPTRRYQQPGELIEALMSLGEQIGMAHAPASNAVWAPPRVEAPSAWQQHLPWLVPVSALVLIVLALDYLWSRDVLPQSPDEPVASSSKESPGKVDSSAPVRPVAGATSRRKPGSTAPPRVPKPPATQVAIPSKADGTVTAVVAQPDLAPAASDLASANEAAELSFEATSAGAVAAGETSAELSIPEGSGPMPAEPGAPIADRGVEREGVLVVSDVEEGSNCFPSLQAACVAARSGDVIELRYNGRREERPISLANTRLTIRAGDRFRPVVLFRPAELDPVKYPRSMLTIAGGALTIINLALELNVPRDVAAETWSLVETRRANSVRLERCSLTIRNSALGQTAYHPRVTFFQVKSAPGAGSMMFEFGAAEPAERDDLTTSIELQNCVARGEATLMAVDDLQPARLTWDNGLLVTSERLLASGGGQMAPRQTGHLSAELRHITAAVRSGLASLATSDEAPYQLTTEMVCADSILAIQAAAPLIEQQGPSRVDDFRTRLIWNGDRNCYEGVELFWKINSTAVSGDMQQFLFSDWRTFWSEGHENLPGRNNVAWKGLPPLEKPLHAHTVTDYALSTSVGNPARGGASDGLDIGVLADLLPALPSDDPPDALRLPVLPTPGARLK